jgi:multiple sugar transport system ATP-binding protein
VVNHMSPRERDVAMVFQNYALYPHMTVRENMGFALKLARLPKAEINARVENAAHILDLDEHLGRRPATLSGGQRQRVAMGRAIVRDPKAFLMDEPLSNLDAKLRVQMRSQVARLQHRLGTTMVYVTHDQTEAMTLGDRVAVMRSGVLQQVDTPKALYESPRNLFVAGFMGSPAMNFVQARLENGVVRLPFGDAPVPGRLHHDAPREVIAGFRPEHFDSGPAAGGLQFRVEPTVVESLGSEDYVFFDVDSDVETEALRELAEDAGADHAARDVVARVDAASRPRIGEPLELVLDTSRLHLFDPTSGATLTG